MLKESYRLVRGARKVNYEYIFELSAEILVGLNVGVRYNARVSLLAVLYEVDNVSCLRIKVVSRDFLSSFLGRELFF